MSETPATSCECPVAGYCQRHQLTKYPHWHKLCQTRRDYFELWETGKGPGQATEISEPEPQEAPPTGPGAELKAILDSIGFDESASCGCARKRGLMNLWGPDGCREHRAEIVDWLNGERKKARTWDLIAAAARLTGRGILLNPADIIGSIVDEAIRRAEAKTTDLKEIANA